MGRKKTEINPIRAERVKKLIEREKRINPKFSQTELAGRINMTQQNISRIINQKTALTEETARDIVKAFPKYRIEWLLGYDDDMTLWERPKNATKYVYRYSCPYCNMTVYYVHRQNDRRNKKEEPKSNYNFCPYCGEQVIR